jgi:ABC-type multidrug transport system fused ATPase/permease subunit
LWNTLSLRENLLLGSPNIKISDAEIKKYIKLVGLEKVVTDLDLIIGEGVDFSGGQNQLLEIVRAMILKKPIIIFDEGTNQLDAEKEAKVLEILEQLKKNTIIIFISHRITSCQKADEVLILENGKISAKDTPKNLLNSKKENLFQKFWKLQVEDK